MPDEHPALRAGLGSLEIQQIGEAYATRHGQWLAPTGTQWRQRLRCLVLEQGDRLVAIFNLDGGRWFRLHEEARRLVEAAAPERRVSVLCLPTLANYNIDFEGWHWNALDARHRRFDPELREQLLAALVEVFQRAWRGRRPAALAIGQGGCPSIAANCYWGDGHTDPTVYVLRIADTEGRLLGAVVNFACRGDDRVYGLGGGLAGACEGVVQRVYGPIPVLHCTTAGADQFPQFADPPPEMVEQRGQPVQQALAPFETREYDRMGRALGGEAVKVLAELEAAGETLLAQNERWRASSWRHVAPGTVLEPAVLRVRTVPLSLSPVPLPPADACAARAAALTAALQARRKALGQLRPRRQPIALDPGDHTDPLFQLMELGAERAYWGIAAGRAKARERQREGPRRHGEACLLAIGPALAIVALPATTCLATVQAIRGRSPFPVTVVWDGLAPYGLGHIVPEAEGALGGVHRANEDYAQGAIDAMVDALALGLHELRRDVHG